MTPALWVLAVFAWLAIALGVALLLGRAIRNADRQRPRDDDPTNP